jgi:serine/threonine-protein kinase RsbW
MNGPWTWSSQFSIPSRTSATTDAIEQLLARLQADAWADRDVFGVHLAVEEALVNAIVHGNGEGSAKQVSIEYRAAPDRVQIVIADEGPGFDPAAVPDCTDAEHLEMPNGRGLMLMKSFMSRVEYNAQGNRVLLEKCRSAE